MSGQRETVVVYLLVLYLVGLAVEGSGQGNGNVHHRYCGYECYKKGDDYRLNVKKAQDLRDDVKIRRCARAASKENIKIFGVKKDGTCFGWCAFSDLDSLEKANNCRNGVGSKKSYYVYYFNRTLATRRGTTVTVRLLGTPRTTTFQTTGTLATPRGTTATVRLLGTPRTTTFQTTGTLATPRGTTATVRLLGTPRTTTLQTTASRLIPQATPQLTTTETVTSTVIRTTASTKNNVVDNVPYYRHMGCFKDEGRPRRAMPDHLGTWKGKNAIKECAKASWRKGYQVFGVQYFGECWSGVHASLTYAKYGHSDACSSDGVGWNWANDVYAFVFCPPGYTNTMNDATCQPCPVDTYEHNRNKCQPCGGQKKTQGGQKKTQGGQKKTWGRKAVANEKQCTDENPIKVPSLTVNIAPNDVTPGLIVVNFTASYTSGSLVIPPLTYAITGVTKTPLQTRTTDVTSGDIDSCSQPNSSTSFPFCIYKHNGSIAINRNFNCSEGDEFVISINVSDSGNDTIGKIVNPDGQLAIACLDECKDVKPLYQKARNACPKTNPTVQTVPKDRENCSVTGWTCLDGVFNWTNSLNIGKCGSDPDELRMRYGHCLVKPTIISGPNSSSVSSETQVTLSCGISSPIPAKITWYRGKGEIVNSSITMNVDNQGYYWCEASNRYRTKRSRKALLSVTDHFTSLIRFKTNENYPNNNQNKESGKPCEHISRYLLSKNASREYKHRSTFKHWNWDNKLGVECVIYGKKKTQDENVNNYYRNLVGILTEGAKKNKIEGIKIDWKSISVKDAGICLGETTGQPNIKGYFTWSSARIGETKTFNCSYSKSSATRRCGGNFNTGAEWNTPDDDNCNYKSKKTQEMDKISKIKLNSGNAKDVAKNFTKLFKSGPSKDMSEDDANLAADMVDKILSVEDRLNETADMVIEIIDTMMEMNASNLKTDVSTRIIKAMDKLAENIPLEEGTTSRVLNSTNLVIQANKVNPSSFKGSTFGIIANKEGGRSVVTSADQINLFVKLPTAVFEKSNKDSSVRIGFIYFANQNLFNVKDEDNDIENERELSKEVLSASVYNNNTNTSALSENVTLTFPRPAGKDLKNSSCVFWKENERTWSGEGCVLCDDNDDDKTSIQCCCNHLTSFAVLFSPEKEPLSGKDEEHARILSIISYVGCGISLAGVILTFLTYSLFRHLRKTNQQPILMNLCVSIALLLIVFAVGIDRTGNRLGCQIVAGLLHYLTLTTIFWMGIEGYNLYLQLVKVMNIYHRKFMLKASIVAWGVPALIVVATVIAAVIEYEMNEDSNRVFYYGNEKVCILHNHLYRIVSWFAPILAILLLNLVIFVLVMYKINSTGAMVPVDTKSNLKKRSWTALAIMSLLGLTWIFGALAISGARLVFEYLFCIFNSLQGFFIFFFHCARIKEVRNQWSFFVSGLGFSHKESETSHQRSRGIGESRHSSEAPYVKVKKWILRKESDSDQPKRKVTMSTVIDNKNQQGNVCDDNKFDMELDDVRGLHENDALELSFESKKRSSCSSKDSCSDNSSS